MERSRALHWLWYQHYIAWRMWASSEGDESRRWREAVLTLEELAVALEKEERRMAAAIARGDDMPRSVFPSRAGTATKSLMDDDDDDEA